ncbi:transcriptional regulator, partial [Mesorhizobium sp. M2D.F.Ca.ET.145.01.1.1]
MNLSQLSSDLDKAFASLADPTRRAILERLTHAGEVAVGGWAER